MSNSSRPVDHDEEWVIWNGNQGLLATGTIGQVEIGPNGRSAWLEKPFDMVGPFNLDELESQGRVVFAACIVMSRLRWQEDQAELRLESLNIRRAREQRHNEEFEHRFGGRRGHRHRRKLGDERQHRETLNLPVEGKLEPSQIKAAFRKLAQKAHPDVGGTHEQFIRITEARNALLERIA